ncbi:MAG: hypothetical protein JNM18_26355 [Planctomycetaceae bacterium]|nr:hypothetical protein [Planctomycetaceae bacterium]
MFARLSKVILSFSIVLSAYWLYAAIAVPLIDPPSISGLEGKHGKVVDARPVEDRQREMLANWFRPDDWEMGTPKVLYTPQGILLINEYKVLEEHSRVELWPCTMIFLPDETSGPPEDRYRRAVIMRSSPDRGKAVLHFDGPFDITHGKIGKMIGGQILGNVTIYSQQRSLGPEDDLLVHARDIELRDNRITSSNIVDLRWGYNTARGQRLRMDLSPDDKSRGFKGLLSVELQQQVAVHLESMDKGLMPGSGTASPPAVGPQQTSSPVEVESRGAFRFDFVEYLATFQDQVNVKRLGSDGASEQLACELLSIYFKKPKRDEQPPPDAPAGRMAMFNNAPRFEPERVVAFGQPAQVRVPANEVLIKAGQIEYEVASGIINLRDGQEVMLQQGKREIHCRELFAEPDESRKLGRFLAKGAGWLKGGMPDDPNSAFSASWTRRLHFRPHERQHVLSLEGKAHVSMVGKGVIDAEEIHLWLNEKRTPGVKPGDAERVELAPDRLMSVGQVTIDSPQLTGTVSQLQAWFESAGINPGFQSFNLRPLQALPHAVLSRHILAQLAVPQIPVNPAVPPTGGEVLSPMAQGLGNKRIHVEGELMRIRARQTSRQLELSEIIIEHDVRVRELATERIDEIPLVITGKKLHLVQQSANEAVVTVSGQPAHIEGRGMTLDSSAISLNRLTNSIWTDGAGQLTMLVDRDPDGKLLSQPQKLEVAWQEKLDFNGRVARFHGGVIARQAQQLVRTQVLEVVLTEPVSFNGDRPAAKRIEVEQLSCRQGVFFENPTFDRNRLVSLDRMQAAELNVHRLSGQLTALGPGWVKTVRLDTGKGKLSVPGQKPIAPVALQNVKTEQLMYVGVEYQGSLSGNLTRREMVFESAVRTIYGPVQHWEGSLNPDKPQEWHQDGLLMTSDRLAITQLPGATPELRTYEMEATGNTVVEGALYTARANRITYAQAKELLVIEGNGRSDAELSYQPKPSSSPSKVNARKIMFWPSANRVEVDDARLFDLNNLK